MLPEIIIIFILLAFGIYCFYKHAKAVKNRKVGIEITKHRRKKKT